MKQEPPASGNSLTPLDKRNAFLATMIVALLLVALILLLRLPFHAKYLTKWDSCNYAFALEHFSVADHFPHPPGYPYYVGDASIINSIVHDANLAYIYEGIMLCCIAAIFIFLTGRMLFGFNVGFFAALLFIVSPMSWYLSSVVLSYISDAALVSVVLYLGIYIHKNPGRPWPIIAMPLAMGFGAGFRIPGFILCLPLYLLHLLDIPWRKRIGSILIVIILAAGGYYWVVQKSGGWNEYRGIVASESVKHTDALAKLLADPIAELLRNIQQIHLFATQSLGPLWFLLFLPVLFPMSAFGRIKREKLFLWLSILVPLLLFTIVYVNFTPIMLILLPVLCLLLTKTLFRLAVWIIRLFPAGRKPDVYLRFGYSMLVLMWAAIAIPAAGQYITMDESSSGPAHEFSLGSIFLNDYLVSNLIETAVNYDPGDTCFLLWMETRHAGYYLRDYHVIWDKYLIRFPSKTTREIYSLKDGKSVMIPVKCMERDNGLTCVMPLPENCVNLIFRQDIEASYFHPPGRLVPYTANDKIGLMAISGIPPGSAIYATWYYEPNPVTGEREILWTIGLVQDLLSKETIGK